MVDFVARKARETSFGALMLLVVVINLMLFFSAGEFDSFTQRNFFCFLMRELLNSWFNAWVSLIFMLGGQDVVEWGWLVALD